MLTKEEVQEMIDKAVQEESEWTGWGECVIPEHVTKKVEAFKLALSALSQREVPGDAREVTGDTSDGYHTFRELYDYRRVYNALLFNAWASLELYDVHKSKKHSDGEKCFGGGWFIVVAQLPMGQISNHYKLEHWEEFRVPEKSIPNLYDGHTPAAALERAQQLALIDAYALQGRGETVELFTKADINDSFLKVIDAATKDWVISGGDAFILGMNQSQLKDWEEWDPIIESIDAESTAVRIRSSYRFDNSRTEKALQEWYQERHEAALDRACDNLGPEEPISTPPSEEGAQP